MQHDHPLPTIASQVASAQRILQLTGQLSSTAEMIIICNQDKFVLALNDLARKNLYGDSLNLENACIFDLIEEDLRPMAPKYFELLEQKKQFSGFVRVSLPSAPSALLAFKSNLIESDGHILLYVTAKFPIPAWGEDRDKFNPAVSLNSVLHYATEPLFIVNPKGIILDINNPALERIGYSRKDLAGKSLAKAFELNPSEKAALLKTFMLVEGQPQRIDWWIKAKDNSYISVEITLRAGKHLGKEVIVGTARENNEQRVLAAEKPGNDTSNIGFMNRLVASIRSLSDASAIMHSTLQQLIDHTDIISGAIYRYVPEKNELQLLSSEKINEDVIRPHQKMPLDPALVKHLAGNSCRPVRHSFSRNFQRLFRKKELLTMPICSFNTLTGIMVLFVEDSRLITPSLTALIYFVGNEIGNAISRLNLSRELSQSENKYRTLFESSHDAVFLSTLETILDCNSRAVELLGYSKEQIKGSKAINYSPEFQPDGQRSDEKASRLLFKTLETGEPHMVEWQNLRSDSTILDTEISVDRIMIDEQYYLQVVMRDITRRKQAESVKRGEEVLRESMKHFRNFLGKVNLPYMSQDLEGNITYVNDYFTKYTGYKRKELIGKNYFELLAPPKQRVKRKNVFTQTIATQHLRGHYEWEIITKTGTLKVVRWNSIFEFDGNGNVTGITSVGKDMTDKRIAMEALKDNKVRLQDLFDNAHDLIQNISIDNKFMFVNRAWKEKLGYDDADIEKLTLNDIVHPYYKAKLIYQFRNLYKGEKVNKIETVFMTKAGKPVHLIGSINCSFQNNKPVATRAILHDITDRIKAERLQKVYYSIANLAISSKDLPSLYSAIHRELSKIIETNNIYIALCNDDKTELTFVYYVDQFIGKNTNLKTKPFALGIPEYVIQTGMPLFMVEKDVQQLISAGKVRPIGDQPKVMMCSPLAIGDRIIGMIAVQDYKKEDAYVSTDIEILHFISNQIALAIERKRNEEQINKQNARLKAIFESGSHMMWSVDRSRVLTSYNQNYHNAFHELNGFYPRLSYTQLLPSGQPSINPDQYESWSEHFRQAYEGQAQHFEIKLLDRTTGEVWQEIFLNPIYMEDGTFEEVSGIALDITDKKKSQLAMAESEEKFRRIFESFQDVYYRSDAEGYIELMSPSISDMLGFTSHETIGMNGNFFYEKPEDRYELMDRLYRQGKVRNFEASFRCKDNSVKQVLINSRLITDNDYNPIGMEAVARDITELKQTQNELIRAKEVAENLLHMKTQFLANMSHELRTPMNGIIGMIDLLTPTTDEQRDFIDTLRRSSDALLDILNDILDLTKVQAGKLVINETVTDLHYTLEKIHSLFSNRAQQKDLQFTYDIAPNTPRFVLTDETRLIQVLSNLTSNAIKFTNHGEVNLTVRSKHVQEEDVHTIEFRVKDSGIGISDTDKMLLFTNFTQLDNSSTKTFGGTGLGLAISKQLSELLGGEIGVDSVYGEGSTFWFTISCQAVEDHPNLTEQLITAREATAEVEQFQIAPYVLLVDDNIINQKVAVKLLEKIGCRADVASNGFEAIEKATSHGYDIIFMDIQMPEMDGITATCLIKEKLASNCPPIVAMTAYSMKDDAERFINQGLDDYISKPVRTTDLYNMIKHWHRGGNGSRMVDVIEVEAKNNLIDEGVLAQLMELGGSEFTIQLYTEFEEETELLLEDAKKEIEFKQYKSILSTLHQIKGTASTLGLHLIAEMAKKLEHDIKQDQLNQVEANFTALINQFELYKHFYKEKLINS